MSKTKIALAVALLVSTAMPALAGNSTSKRHAAMGTKQSTSMRAEQTRNMSMMPNGNLMMNVMDRASSPFACGG